MNRSEIASLDDLRAFEATGRLGSVRRAAEHLSLTHGAVSRRINKLSEDLGFQVFERSGRGLHLTPAGETLFLSVNRFLDDLQSTVHRLRIAGDRNTSLVLSCEPSVAMRWLIPRLSRFQSDNPDIVVHLSVGGGPIDFQRERVDLAIRRLDFALPGSWKVRRLFAERVGPVMAPHLAEEFETGSYIGLGSKTRAEAWTQWLSLNQRSVQPTEVRYHDHHFLMVEAASCGLGVAMSPLVLATDDIERGRLIAPLGFSADDTHYGLIWPNGEEQGS